jgi:peptidoglycan hydrolase-like protein with peptidoglycan-binding domain
VLIFEGSDEMPDQEAFKDYMPRKAGLAYGAKGADVKRTQHYLKKFGYLRDPKPAKDDAFASLKAAAPVPAATDGAFDDATVVALRRFQQFAGLPITGELDEATQAKMTEPRCGFPDIPSGGATGAGPGISDGPGGLSAGSMNPASFTTIGCKWPSGNLTYHFQNFTADLTEAQARNAIKAAFKLWSQAAPLSFTESTSSTADIIIRFVAGDHGDGNPFDGPSGVLAHGYYPAPCGGGLAGDVHFDEAETWTVALPVPAGGIDLVSVAAHEFGHALGLAHSTVPNSLMNPFYTLRRYLSADDVLGIQTLYGARIRAVPGWFGSEDQGADIAIADISGNGRPDLVVFHVDNPGGDNHGYYRIGWNLDRYGNVTGGWSAIMPVPGWFGWEDQGAGIAIGDINGNGKKDLIVFHVDNPSGDNHGYYRIGCDLDHTGKVTAGWTSIHPVPGWFGWENQGAAIALRDISGNGMKDLVVFHLDNPGGDNHGYYRIGWNVDAAGNVTGGWSAVIPVPGWFGWENQGAGIAIADINNSGRPDLLVFHIDNPAGENHGYYRVGWNLDTAGNVAGGWGPIVALPGWFGSEDQGAGVALADINGTGRQDLVVFHVDNPGGENHGYYRVITDL